MAADILQRIVARKQERLSKAEQLIPFSILCQRLEAQRPLRRPWPLAPDRFDLIAEIKRASPSLGPIHWQHSLSELVQHYELGGAGTISVLTEEDFFCGSLEDLAQVRKETSLAILRKDFLWTEYQLVESRVVGADAILLIVALLDQETLQRLFKVATELGLEVLVECHDLQEIERAIQVGAHNIGINNRDLRTFEVSLSTTLELLQAVSKDCVIVSESGIRLPEDAGRLAAAGVNAILVGESCVRQINPSRHIADLLEQGRKQHKNRL